MTLTGVLMAVEVTECGCQAHKTVVWDLILAELAAQDSAVRPARREPRRYTDDVVESHFSSTHALALVCRHLRDRVQALFFRVVLVYGIHGYASLDQRRVQLGERALSVYYALAASPNRARLSFHTRAIIVEPCKFLPYLVDMLGAYSELKSLRLLSCQSNSVVRIASILRQTGSNLAYLQLRHCTAENARHILLAIPHRLSRLSLQGLYCNKADSACVISCDAEELLIAPHTDKLCGLQFIARSVPSRLVIESNPVAAAINRLLSQCDLFSGITSLTLTRRSTGYQHWVVGSHTNGEPIFEPSVSESSDSDTDEEDGDELENGDIVAADFELMEHLAISGTRSGSIEHLLDLFHPDDLARAKALINKACGVLHQEHHSQAERASIRSTVVFDALMITQQDRELAKAMNKLSHLKELDMRNIAQSLAPGVNRDHPALKYIALSDVSPFCDLSDLKSLPAGLREVAVDNPTIRYSYSHKVSLQTLDQAMDLARDWSEVGPQCRVRGHIPEDQIPVGQRYRSQLYMPICGEGTWWPREEYNELPEHRVFSDTV